MIIKINTTFVKKTMEKQELGAILKAARERLGKTRYRVALEAGIKQEHLKKVEEGECGSTIKTVSKIADSVGLKILLGSTYNK